MKPPSLTAHIRDILILPFTVTVVIPFFIYNPQQRLIPNHILLVIVGILFLVSGLTLFFITVFLFKTIGKGTLAPWQPTQKLVIAGPYLYCRNPMITGVLFILTGQALIFHSVAILIWAVTFFLINTTYFILKEEPDLVKRFGEDYLRYKTHVPKWLPNIKPYKQ